MKCAKGRIVILALTNLCVINYNQTSVLSVCWDFRILVICLERWIGINNVDFFENHEEGYLSSFSTMLVKTWFVCSKPLSDLSLSYLE